MTTRKFLLFNHKLAETSPEVKGSTERARDVARTRAREYSSHPKAVRNHTQACNAEHSARHGFEAQLPTGGPWAKRLQNRWN